MTLTLRALHAPHPPLLTPRWRTRPCERLVHGLAMLPTGDRFVGAWEDGSLAVISRADGQCITRLKGHEGPVNCLRATPDGSRFLTGGDDCTVRLWDARTLECLAVFGGRQSYVRSLALTDARAVTCDDGGRVQFWDLAACALRHTREESSSGVVAAALSDDGAIAATMSRGGELVLWDATTGTERARLTDTPSTAGAVAGITALCFLDNRRLLGANTDLHEWDAETGEHRACFDRQGWWVSSFARHPTRPLIAVARRGAGLYDTDARARRTTVDRGGETTSALVFTPDGEELITGDDKGSIAAWRVEDALKHTGFSAHEDSVYRLVVGGERAMTGAVDGSVHRWNLRDGRSVGPVDVRPVAHGEPMGLSPSGEVAVTCAPEVTFWRGDARALVAAAPAPGPAHCKPLATVVVNDTQCLVGMMADGVGVYALRDDAPLAFEPLEGATRQVDALVRSPDGRYLATIGYFEDPETKRAAEARALEDAEAAMRAWAAQTGKRARKVRAPYVSVDCVMHLQLWDLSTRRLCWTRAGVPPSEKRYFNFGFVRFLSTGELVTAAEDALGLLRVRALDGAVTREIPFDGDHLYSVELLDGDLLVGIALRKDSARLTAVDLVGARVTRAVEVGIAHAAFRRDGALAALRLRGAVDFVSTRDGTLQARYESAADFTQGAFSPDGTRWVGGDQEGRVHILALDGLAPTRPQPAADALPPWVKPEAPPKRRAKKKG